MLFPDFQFIPYLPPYFIIQKTTLTWGDIQWAYKHQMFGSMMFVKIAHLKKEKNDLEIELSSLDKDHLWRAGEIVSQLAEKEPVSSEERTASKWLFIILSYIYENKNQFDDPLQKVEDVYEDFGHPEEMNSFVRYMPANLSEYDPRKHSEEENIQHLYLNLDKYLQQQKLKFQQ